MQINEQARNELLSEVNGLTAEHLNQKPSKNEWSIKEILEHLYLMEGAITESIQKQLASPEINVVKEKPIELTVNRDTKVDAPSFAVPSEDYATLDELKEKLAYTHGNLEKLVENEDKMAMKNKAFPHPVFGDMSLDQWIPFIAYHEMRHTDQIKEVKKKLGI
ncbi:DinB family protein [Virgibacillus halodenitrificans]|uniref:DinB-like domain-containing protein n=1 Tax=Virgibacillus halodenitrificans TaxID=1482 RepID=A0AAC9J0J8_VIRHA|nr:DinB family protein [Virgibacillus halodenitrificans]APC47369.1 hypothetical protein BME96_03940 [Virgibacillus halodenitrificans]MCG1029726.1 DinB family protein [Virgibacillus halodenitrificans]MEC2160635.1 DinB family protein [Virgibacillus halodenitrificans]CDQ32177.1 DinB superfamily protein [Virgibacillus halodenitrificans]